MIIAACNNYPKERPELFELIIEEYNIYGDSSDFNSLYNHYKSNRYIPVTIESDNIEQVGSMRIRGDSSRDYDKKSLKVKIKAPLSINNKRIFNFNA